MLSKGQGVSIYKTFWPCNVCWCGNSLGGRNEGSKMGDIIHPFKGGPLNLLI